MRLPCQKEIHAALIGRPMLYQVSSIVLLMACVVLEALKIILTRVLVHCGWSGTIKKVGMSAIPGYVVDFGV